MFYSKLCIEWALDFNLLTLQEEYVSCAIITMAKILWGLYCTVGGTWLLVQQWTGLWSLLRE